MADVLAWYLVVQVAAVAVWPFAARALSALDDRGWAASKVLGILAMAWLVWFVCMLLPIPFTRATLAIAVLGIGGIAWGLEIRQQHVSELTGWLRRRGDLVLAWEAVFLVGLIVFAVLRSRAPAIAFTEKPMDMAFLNGFIAAQRLPTQDTWLSGFGVPYYHFGYFVLACVAKLSGVQPGVAYNLAAAVVPALTMVGVAALVWNLARAASVQVLWSLVGACIAVLLVVFGSNFATFFEFLASRGLVSPDAGEALGIKNFAANVSPGVWPPNNASWWFFASRIIPNLQPDGINEFPFFSALLSDLHPHFVALPFEVLALTAACAMVLSRGAALQSPWALFAAALALGGLLVINTWDIAPYWLLFIGLAVYAATFTTWRWRWVAAIATPFAGALLYAPYFVGYSSPPLGLGIVRSDRTPLSSELVLFGWAVVLLGAFGLFTRWCVGDRQGWRVAGLGALAGIALAILGEPTVGLLLALLVLLLPWPGVLGRFDPAALTALGIGAFSVAMLLGVELIFLDDVFHSRMNTVFKFHENAWLLAGLASGVSVALVGRFTLRARWVVSALAGVVLVPTLVYPLSAIASRMNERPSYGVTLDGVAFLGQDDRSAVRWLVDQQNQSGGRVVIAEAPGDEYSSGSKFSTYSGASTVLGWAGHELQWRGPIPELGRRDADLRAIYHDAPPDAVRSVLDRYSVRFVVVGDLERQKYGDEVLTRFDSVFPVGFRTGSVTIYRTR